MRRKSWAKVRLLHDAQVVGVNGRVEVGPQDVLAARAARGALGGPHERAAVPARRARGEAVRLGVERHGRRHLIV